MKKWLALAVLALAGAIVGVAGAAPALTAHRDPVNVPMFADWYTPAPDGWYTIDDAGVLSGPHYGPVSASAPVMIDVAWVGQSYGHTSAVPDVDQLRLTITKGDRTIVAQTSAQGRAAWTQVFPWDDYWVGLLGEAPPFNPSIAAGTFGIKWENVFPAGTFAPGVYHVTIDERFTHTYNDLSAWPGAPARPVRLTPYTGSYEFSFTVA